MSELTVVTWVAKIGESHDFKSLTINVPCWSCSEEYSSGSSQWQGSLTKIGNAQIRRCSL
ncbi:hypothetical protein [Neobacillus drentensis]|uniref:hypothetical protein n=1 Tax=Neobacillus drentensis TaxID=220684 RepID=UPI003B5878D4